MAEEQGVLGALDKYNLDALIMPTFASFHLPAIAGLPVITVPLGFYPAETPVMMNAKGTMVMIGPGVPFGIAFLGRRWSEELLVGLAYAFEQRMGARKAGKPLISPSFELEDLRPVETRMTHTVPESSAQEDLMKQSFPEQKIRNPTNGYSMMRQWTLSALGFLTLLEDPS